MQRFAKLWLTLFICIILISCSLVPLRLRFNANSKLNLDPQRHSLPVLIRVYQLSSAIVFTQANFNQLWHADSETLGNSLINQEEFILSPAKSLDLNLNLQSNARYIGIMAVFREHQQGKWRIIKAIPNRALNLMLPITITCVGDSLSLVRK